MNNKRIEDIENHMLIEDLLYDGDGFVRESDFIFDDDLEDFSSIELYETDSEGNPVLPVSKEDMDLLDVLKYRGEKTVIDVEGNK